MARKAGLFWGGDWRSFKDRPHVQAIPVKHQQKVRDADDVAALLAAHPELTQRKQAFSEGPASSSGSHDIPSGAAAEEESDA